MLRRVRQFVLKTDAGFPTPTFNELHLGIEEAKAVNPSLLGFSFHSDTIHATLDFLADEIKIEDEGRLRILPHREK